VLSHRRTAGAVPPAFSRKEAVKEAQFWRSRPPKINGLRVKNRAFLGFFYRLKTWEREGLVVTKEKRFFFF
jgi:hypothetical protein